MPGTRVGTVYLVGYAPRVLRWLCTLGLLLLTACPQEIGVRDTGPGSSGGRDAGPGGGGADGALDAGVDAAEAVTDGAAEDAGGGLDVIEGDAAALDALAGDAVPVDGGTHPDAAVDAGAPDAAPPDAGALDPLLALPNPNGQVCTYPGGLGECPGAEVCRFYSPVEGRCESCTSCGNLFAPCTRSDDCDIVFVCYAGYCTNFCELGGAQCGALSCIDIGHPSHGVCPPEP